MYRVVPLIIVWIFLLTGVCRSQFNNLEGAFEIYSTQNNSLDEVVLWSLNFPGNVSTITQIRYGNTFYLFFYDRVNGSAFLLDSDLTIARNYYNLSKTIYKIVPDDLDGDGKDELFFYDQFNGKAEICSLGREIKRLIDAEFRQAGNYTSYLNASNLASGIYYAMLYIDGDDDYTNVCKIALVK